MARKDSLLTETPSSIVVTRNLAQMYRTERYYNNDPWKMKVENHLLRKYPAESLRDTTLKTHIRRWIRNDIQQVESNARDRAAKVLELYGETGRFSEHWDSLANSPISFKVDVFDEKPIRENVLLYKATVEDLYKYIQTEEKSARREFKKRLVKTKAARAMLDTMEKGSYLTTLDAARESV